jgi:hypothetical protein
MRPHRPDRIHALVVAGELQHQGRLDLRHVLGRDETRQVGRS